MQRNSNASFSLFYFQLKHLLTNVHISTAVSVFRFERHLAETGHLSSVRKLMVDLFVFSTDNSYGKPLI